MVTKVPASVIKVGPACASYTHTAGGDQTDGQRWDFFGRNRCWRLAVIVRCGHSRRFGLVNRLGRAWIWGWVSLSWLSAIGWRWRRRRRIGRRWWCRRRAGLDHNYALYS